MKIALVIGNRYTPWHFEGYRLLRGTPDITVFRADSEVQRYFDERNDRDLGFKFEQVFFTTQDPNPFTRRVNQLKALLSGVEPYALPFWRRLKGFDLIQSWELFSDWSDQALVAHERYGAPQVVMVWDNIPFNMEQDGRQRAIKQRVKAGATAFVVHTERSRRMLAIEGVSADCIRLIPPGVDTDRFAPGPGNRAAFGLDDDDFVILFVGWFLPRKGLEYLLFALRELLDDPRCADRRVKLLIVGSGPGKARIDDRIARLDLGGACVFAGALPYSRMPDAYRCADVFALPSVATPEWQEQFAMSIIEAMACGVPVVSTYGGAIPEIAGEAAVLCQPADFASLKTALADLMHGAQRRHELAALGRTRATTQFPLARFAASLSDVYASLRRS